MSPLEIYGTLAAPFSQPESPHVLGYLMMRTDVTLARLEQHSSLNPETTSRFERVTSGLVSRFFDIVTKA